MRATERTLIASLGFADPDKKNALHYLACHYLIQKPIIEKLCALAHIKNDENIRLGIERPIEKGTGNYKTIVGFLDVFIEGNSIQTGGGRAFCGIEVKATEQPWDAVVRQVQFYRSFVPPHRIPATWFIATPFPMTEADVSFLKAVHINHLHLGEDFTKFVELRKTLTNPAPTSIAI